MIKPVSLSEGSEVGCEADTIANPIAHHLAEANAQKLVQELQLHKIELEMQNEELLRIQEELRASWEQIDHLVVERTAELAQAELCLSAEVRQRLELEAALQAANRELELLRQRVNDRPDWVN